MAPTRQVVWITGASSGIGAAAARQFARHGACVAISARRAEKLGAIAAEIGADGGECFSIPCDVTNADDVEKAAREIARTCGPIDVLVNNAGVTVFKSMIESTIEDFDALVATNLRGVFLCTKSVLPSMVERGRGTIFMINSVTSKYEFANSSIYAATKAGVKAMTDVMRKELRAKGIRFVSLYPGATNTDIWSTSMRNKHGERMMRPDDVAALLVNVWQQPQSVTVEELFVRPIGGDL